MNKKRLLTRADDAGLSRTVNRAVAASARQGIVRNISLLAPGPEITGAARSLKAVQGTVDFGLHVCLTAEWQNLRWGPVSPASDIPKIVQDDNSFFHAVDDLSAQSPNVDDLMIEVRAQFDRLTELGFTLSYVDEHMGVGRIDGFADGLRAFCKEKGLIYDRDLAEGERYTRLPGWSGPAEHPGTELADQLAATPPGTYLLVGHPGYKENDVLRLRRPGQDAGIEGLARNRQRRMFMDIEIVDYCETSGIRLLRYTDLA